ncbi:MAG: phosphoribosylanthranilate isomerase [Saprospiraceae bacterium]|nr:phosphoribosylanthranilate isomerase [Saprospiraceae bacterium]
MKIKVCGIKYQDNLDQMVKLPIDMIGFNFYAPSSRYLKAPLHMPSDTTQIKYVGVFVNEEIEVVKEKIEEHQLDYVQLHGNESPQYVYEVSKIRDVIKVFSVNGSDDFRNIADYEDAALFLFDTKTPQYGGSGLKFKWELLQHYQGSTPFLLAGGIGPEDCPSLYQVNHRQFHGVDINSKFEVEPGRKDPKLITQFVRKYQELYNTNLNNT